MAEFRMPKEGPVMRRLRIVVWGVVPVAALVLGAPAGVTAQGGGAIAGEVNFVGTPAAPKVIKVNKDNQACGNEKISDELVVGPNKGIQWAVVSVVGAKGSPPKPARKPVLDQKGCWFQPHVLLVPPGVEVDVLNPDGVLHNVHTFPKVNPAVNRAQPKFKKVMPVTFGDKPEIMPVRCDAHGWMLGWIVVMGQPYYAVTDEKGAFRIEGVPPGKHTLEVWHEMLGKVTREVEVKVGAETRVVFELVKK